MNLTVKDFILGDQYIGNILISNIPVVGELLVKSEEDVTVKLIETSSKFTSEDGKEWDITVSGIVKAGVATLKLNVTGADLKDGMILGFSGDVTEEEAIARGKEANILALNFKGDFEVVEQPALKAGDTDLVLTVKYGITDEAKKAMPFTFTLSDGATMLEPTEAKLDLSGEEEAVIKVLSQDKKTTKEYTVSLVVKLPSILYDMEEWVLENPEETDEAKWLYAPGPEGVWATSNKGAAYVSTKCVFKSEAEHTYSGKASVKIETKDTKPSSSFLEGLIPRVTSGSLFTGVFELNMFNPLNSTKFGVSFDKEPLSVSGYYKYASGTEFYEVQAGNKKGAPTLVPGRKDKCAIGAYLYEYDPADEEVKKYNSYLTGENIKKSDRVIAKAELEDGTEKASYTFFELNLKYIKEYDSSKKYRLAIIASSSAEGDAYSGAPGSVLYLDDIEVSYIPN